MGNCMTSPGGQAPMHLSRFPGASYEIDTRLDEFVDTVVEASWAHHGSVDDTVAAVAELIRTTAPTDLAHTDLQWEPRWRAYFEYYDHALMRAIRSHIELDVR